MRFTFAILLVALLGVSQAANQLKCFDCVDCDESKGSPKTCAPNQEVCMKIVAGDHVIRRCSERELCGLGKIERASNRVWTSITNVFKDVDEDAKTVYCCEDEYCNSGLKNLPSLVVLLLPLIFVSFFKF